MNFHKGVTTKYFLGKVPVINLLHIPQRGKADFAVFDYFG